MIGLNASRVFRSALFSTVAVCVSYVADAQTTDAPVESVTVTGSLISRPGFVSPTPVTAVGSADLEKAAEPTLADSLNQLPQFGSAISNHDGFQAGQYAGANFINLRNLGLPRTLVLVNGERTVASSLTNSVDLNTLPTTLIQRVDVVTAGASASYGSDAVAGVVNVIMNNSFDGFKASAEYSNNDQNAFEAYKADAAVGFDFDGGRGHVVASASYFDQPQFYFLRQTGWNQGTALVNNPAFASGNGQPQYIHVNHIGQPNEAQGGVITAGPLSGTQFVGPNAIPTSYNPGVVNGTISYGGDADQSYLLNSPIGQPQNSYNFYTYASYKVTPAITAHLEMSYGADGGLAEIGEYQRANNVPIAADNPYIPAATRALMTQLGVTSFNLGSNNLNLGNPGYPGAGVIYPNRRKVERIVLGFDGTFFGDWSWNAYYSHSEAHFGETWLNDVYIPYYNLAIDAVTAPVGNSAGIAPGTVVCRSTLTTPTNGCKPLNVFGVGTASAAAINYVTPPQFTEINNRQDVASFSAQGSPIDDWAGSVSIAAGGAYRSESATSVSNALAYTRQYAYGNALPFEGAVNVWEGFVETVVPLARNEWWAQSMDFNAAGRVTDYSTSGVVETWKLGLNDQVSDEYRLRLTWSNDIRAPNLAELFSAPVSGGTPLIDPFHPTAGATNPVTNTQGNRNLQPEQAYTVSGGIVWTPNWAPGLSASFDWYSIDIKNAIASVSTVNILNYCFQGQAYFCQFITRNAQGLLTSIVSSPTNSGTQTTSGLDAEVGYSEDLWGGNLDLRLLANYTDENVITQNGNQFDNAGSLSASTIVGAGVPKFKSTISVGYTWGPYSATIQSRIFGSAHLINGYDTLIDNNDVPAIAYLDLRGSYNVTDQWQVYGAIDNVLDQNPPSVPQLWSTGNAYYQPGTNAAVYDTLGRQYRIGVRVRL